MKTEDELKEVLSPSTIAKRVFELGEKITKDYQNNPLILIGILKGAFIFMADLVRAIKLPIKLDFVRLSSYAGTESSGGISFSKDIELDITGLDVLVVEDIIDTGYTIKYLKEVLKLHEPASVRICCLIDKKERRKVEIEADYVGFEIRHGFLVGYGLDYNEQYRYLPGIYKLNPGYKPIGFVPSDR
ncbi:MAG: hypoxanthine phosphoribosyltransferase [Dissulfurimicrobium sp.]|uniref:hypoxanthine phosphoribosyltransferase n=1 Tax=Dissulfurimicrobium TaxID=1769732 RepID=UPI001EDB343D|nr:hypoxanthine phosphoribosyltransferase [Dissulfurimicrobium hydrothermale]UKL13199.1 hypoxanthine phosphoribosyltransferase [Dissulfurimicrobium hydrothermale]